jgi:hypothetical protein
VSAADAVVFLGPSLPVREASTILPGAAFLPPARQGDVLRALRRRPRAIALVDGVFESQPSVWHQELRVAMAEGVTVFGASSMGALRAVELAPSGMIGVGSVFRAYQEGRLVDDADVALLHADAEHDHRPLTVPLVNVISQAEAALDARVLGLREARALVEAARAIHYKDRRWPAIFDALGWPKGKRDAFDAYRRAHPRDVKADDARACLRAVRELCGTTAAPMPVPLQTLSTWTRREWLDAQGPPPASDGRDGLRTLVIAAHARRLGLNADPERVARFEASSPQLDAGLRRRFAEALALEELVLAHPALLDAQAPLADEGRWVEAMRRQG